MKIRKRSLGPGWYPDTKKELLDSFDAFIHSYSLEPPRTSKACVIPHAGWYFSGKLACYGLKHLEEDIDTLVIVGGHLPSGAGVLAGEEEFWEVPGGSIASDRELLGYLSDNLNVQEDIYDDNTVEIQVPLVHLLYPGIKVLGLRVSPGLVAIELGQILAEYGHKSGKKIAVAGSTDLTHYGKAYRFAPKGSGPEARQWVMEKNDRGFIDLLLENRFEDACNYALDRHAACSSGAAATAGSFALESGAKKSKILDYYTSYDISGGKDFVGYAGLVYY